MTNDSQSRVHFSPPESSDGPKRSLVLAGGGIRVSYQAGVLLALSEAGLDFFHADGTSGGTLNLAMLLSGLDPREMCRRWRGFDVKDTISPLPLSSYLKATERMAMGDADGLIEKAFPQLGIDVERIRQAQGLQGTFNVCNFSRKTNEVIAHQELALELLVAGVSLPIFLPPVEYQGALYTDSVWIKDANLMEAVRRGAEELWLVWCIGNTPKYHPGIFRQYVHMIELSANGALFEEFERIRELNERIARGDSPYGQRQPIRLHVIKPEEALPLDPDLYLGRITPGTLIAMGYADARRYLAHHTDEGLPFEPEATQMNEAKTGLTFRETMTGGFALGETDPRKGHEVGEEQGHELAMHATVTLRDLERFLDDPEHPGDLDGTIDFPPWGENIPALTGVFNLFFPTDQPKLKLMVYELGFQHQGKDYYLAGRKEVRDDPGFDLWKDTTTLFTQLHEGTDKSGPVVGAGILSLGVTDLIKLLSTVRIPHAASATEKAKAVAKFGRFFLGELWDSYIHHVDTGEDADEES